jgi:FtsZ-binding cell division protein ZapB
MVDIIAFGKKGQTMSITALMTGLKNKVLDAATYELLRRNFELLEENNSQLKEKVEFQKEEIGKLKAENLHLSEKCAGLQAKHDMLRREDEFVMYQGLAFKKNVSGGVAPQPYCPKCHDLLSTMNNSIFDCRHCDYVTAVFEHPVDIAKKLSAQT